jgi:DNA-binding response OmpR family regulator
MYSKILLVEDEPVLRRVIVRNLDARGANVIEAETTQQAIELLSESPDLILLDINLPDRSGWDVLRHLRAEGKSIPTIIVSAVRVSPDRLAEFKPLAYLPKPFPIDALMRVVEEASLEEEQVVE